MNLEGHLIKNKADSLIRLQEEYHSLEGTLQAIINSAIIMLIKHVIIYVKCVKCQKEKYFERGTKENSDTRDNGDNKENRILQRIEMLKGIGMLKHQSFTGIRNIRR